MESLERRAKSYLEYLPVVIILFGGITACFKFYFTVVDIRAEMTENKLARDKQLAERDVKVAERQKKEDADHDLLTKYSTIVDCMRFKNCQ